jgi:hypothetical protein
MLAVKDSSGTGTLEGARLQTSEDVFNKPHYIYELPIQSNRLVLTSLRTGEHSFHRIPCHYLEIGASWSELPGTRLFVSGGYVTSEVFSLDIHRDFAESHHPPMFTSRSFHGSVSDTTHLYILGGHNYDGPLQECERYVWADSRWEHIPGLPRNCSSISGTVVNGSLYALEEDTTVSSIQRLRLDELSWDVLELELPYSGPSIPLLKVKSFDAQLYFVMEGYLYAFQPLTHKVQQLSGTLVSLDKVTYYHRGYLYGSSSLEPFTRRSVT